MALSDKVQQLSRNIPFKPSTLISCLTLLFLTIAAFHSTSRIASLERRSGEHDIQLLKRSSEKKNVGGKAIVAAGAIYIRWGRSVCPKTANLIYDGISGGQFYTHTGGSSDIICLPKNPIWENFTSAGEASAYIYGIEYEVSLYRLLGKNGMFSSKNAQSLHDHNVPCAVCQTNHPGSVIMVPARNRCHTGWILEYSGYLMTSHYNHKGRTSYNCVDRDPEADPAGYRDENGALFYPVQASCGSLSCPPYVQNRELTCAVCSKLASVINIPVSS